MNKIVQNFEPPFTDEEAIKLITITCIAGLLFIFYYTIIKLPETPFWQFAMFELFLGLFSILLIRGIRQKP